jgi:hypothetical protein
MKDTEYLNQTNVCAVKRNSRVLSIKIPSPTSLHLSSHSHGKGRGVATAGGQRSAGRGWAATHGEK